MSDSGHRDLDCDRVFGQEHGRVVATLIRYFGDIDLAQEAAQEAFASPYNAGPTRAAAQSRRMADDNGSQSRY